MKTLITNSIIIKGMGKTKAKTIFNSVDKEDRRYFDISKLCGQVIMLDYSYSEDEKIKIISTYFLLSESLTEEQARDEIIAKIQAELV